MFTDDVELYVVPTRRGSVVTDYVLVVNETAAPKKIQSTFVDAAKARNLTLTISPEDITLSGMSTQIRV